MPRYTYFKCAKAHHVDEQPERALWCFDNTAKKLLYIDSNCQSRVLLDALRALVKHVHSNVFVS
jgi:hypothetical protein